MQLNIAINENFFMEVLQEDIGINGDITSNILIDQSKTIDFSINARKEMIVCGVEIVEWYFNKFGITDFEVKAKDKSFLSSNSAIIKGRGNLHTIFLLERTILNFLQHLSGVATLTNKFVNEVAHTKAQITDTRKTIPNLRKWQKYAVVCGGGNNHRLALDSAIMIKDNHISACGGDIASAINRASIAAPHYTKIILECDNLSQLEIALKTKVDIILLDNMSITELEEAVRINKNKVILEASGGVNLSTVKRIAETGIDFIAVGQLTHSAPAVDIGLDI